MAMLYGYKSVKSDEIYKKITQKHSDDLTTSILKADSASYSNLEIVKEIGEVMGSIFKPEKTGYQI